jgi:hypothetical protein
VRELAGEIWAEWNMEKLNAPDNSALTKVPVDAEQHLLDILMGVLARHEGSVIVIDQDIPVEPLPKRFAE